MKRRSNKYVWLYLSNDSISYKKRSFLKLILFMKMLTSAYVITMDYVITSFLVHAHKNRIAAS